MWYIKTQRTSCLVASFSTFCAVRVTAGLRSPCISAFFLADLHHSLGSWGDSYRCAGFGCSEASRHLEDEAVQHAGTLTLLMLFLPIWIPLWSVGLSRWQRINKRYPITRDTCYLVTNICCCICAAQSCSIDKLFHKKDLCVMWSCFTFLTTQYREMHSGLFVCLLLFV